MIARDSLGYVIRSKRRHLDLTQEEVARRLGRSATYIAHIEANRRRPSDRIVLELANVLGLDGRELFLLAHPQSKLFLSEDTKAGEGSAWDKFSAERNLHQRYSITDQEMKVLRLIASKGNVQSARDFVYILNAIRYALDRQPVGHH